MKSGYIYWSPDVATVSTTGKVMHKTRPILILSNAKYLESSGITLVVPFLRQVHNQNTIPTHVLVGEGTSFSNPRILLLEQICTVSQEDLGEYLGNVVDDALRDIKKSAQLQFGKI